jgi:hypothetical protein
MESTLKMELDNMERILDRVSPYLPKSVIEQLEGHEISALDSIRLLSLLPADAFENFPDMPSTVLTFPRDHNRHYFQSSEWFFLALNLKTVGDEDMPSRRIGALGTIVGHTVNPQNPATFALEKTNQLFRHSFQLTTGATDSSACEHWYINDKGGFIGDYRPSVHDELPVLSFGESVEQGLLPYGSSPQFDDESELEDELDVEDRKQMRWFMQDEESGAEIDIILTIPDDVQLLLQGSNLTGTIVKPDLGLNWMYYSFPYLEARGTVTFPASEDTLQSTVEVSGAGWLDHQGGVVKSKKGLPKHIDEWKTLLGMEQHRMAWIWTMAQFPQKNIFITGACAPINPRKVKKEATFTWRGSITTKGGNTVYYKDGQMTIKAVYQSPSIKTIYYPTEIEIAVGNQVFSIKSICPDQRAFPADQGEIYEGASDSQIISDSKTVKPKGVGWIECMGFTTERQLEEYQLSKLEIAPLLKDLPTILSNANYSITNQTTTGPIIVIIFIFAMIGTGAYLRFKK